MKNELAALTAFARQLDDLIQEIEKHSSAERPEFLQRANDFVGHALNQVTRGQLPPDYLVDLLDIQKQLTVEVAKLNRPAANSGH